MSSISVIILSPPPLSLLDWKHLFFSSKCWRPLTEFYSLQWHPEVAWPHIFRAWVSLLQTGVSNWLTRWAEPQRCQFERNQTPAERLLALWSRPASDFAGSLRDAHSEGKTSPRQLDGRRQQDSKTLGEPPSPCATAAAVVCLQHRRILCPSPNPQPSSSRLVRGKTDGCSFSKWVFVSATASVSQETLRLGKKSKLSPFTSLVYSTSIVN